MVKLLCSWVRMLVCGCAVLGCVAIGARAGEPNGPDLQSNQSTKKDAQEGSEDTDKAVLDFVKEHQPKLADLLSFLKKKKSKDYNEAMRESRKVRDRLLSIKERDPDMYAVELDIWKNSAQIRLLAAAVSAKSNQLSHDDRARLEELIKYENELTIKRLNLEKARLESRLNQLSQQLTRRQEQADSVQAKSLKVWENRIERSGAKLKKKE